MTIAQRLTALLKRQGFSLAEVARSAGMSKQQVHQIVSGERANPGILTVQRIVEGAGVTMAEFFGDDAE